MKKTKVQAKLSLNKEALAKLTRQQSSNINGGDDTLSELDTLEACRTHLSIMTNCWWVLSRPFRCPTMSQAPYCE